MDNEPISNFDIPFANSSDDIETIENENSIILHNHNEDIEYDPDENLMDLDNKEKNKHNINADDWEKVN